MTIWGGKGSATFPLELSRMDGVHGNSLYISFVDPTHQRALDSKSNHREGGILLRTDRADVIIGSFTNPQSRDEENSNWERKDWFFPTLFYALRYFLVSAHVWDVSVADGAEWIESATCGAALACEMLMTTTKSDRDFSRDPTRVAMDERELKREPRALSAFLLLLFA